MKKTKFFTCIAALTLVFSLGACESGDIYIDMGGVDIGGDSSSESEGPEESTPDTGSEEHTHSYELTDSKDATCTEAGYKTYTCSCGDTYTETIDALGHDYEPTVTDPTCGVGGYTTYVCSRCGDTYTANETDPTGEHNPSSQYYSDENGHWQICSVCDQVVGFEAHTPAQGYESDETSHWQVCSVCGYKMNEETHTEGSTTYIDQTYHGVSCTVCNKLLSQEAHNFNAVWDEDLEDWTRVCTDCGLESGSITYDGKYVITGDFGDSTWTVGPTDENLILEYDSRYQNTKHWIRTVTTTEYDRQGYDAGFRICNYSANNTWTTIADYSNLDLTTSIGVLGDGGGYDHNILLDWSTTYTIEVDCSGTTPKIVVTYVSGGYEEEDIDGYAIVGSFDGEENSWNAYPDLDSVYYLEPNDDNHWERTITAGGDASYSGFRVTDYGSFDSVADAKNLTADSTGVTGETSGDYNILTTPGETYDVVIDIGDTTTIKVTIHKEPITDEDTLQAALNEGGYITLESDIEVSTNLIASVDATLDMNGYKIYNETDIWDTAGDVWSLLSIQNGAKFTITGNGTFAGLENDPYAVDVRDNSTLTIENGTFIGNLTCIYAYEGFVTIYDGHFSIIQLNESTNLGGPYKFLLNCLDANNKAGTACFYLYGGEYENFDPSVATGTKDDDGNTLFEAVIMEGYKSFASVIGSNTIYTVAPDPTLIDHTFVTDLASMPAAGFGEEGADENPNPKNGTWTRGQLYYWNSLGWDGLGTWVTVNKAAYNSDVDGYEFSWSTESTYSAAWAFQIFYTLPSEAGLDVGATYSVTLYLSVDFTGDITVCGQCYSVTEGLNIITVSGLTATQKSDLSIQPGDVNGVGDGSFIPSGTITLHYVGFDYAKADIEEGETEYHSYVVDFGSTTLNYETDVVSTIGNHLGEFSYFYNFVSGDASISSEGLTFSYDKDSSAVVDPEWSSVTLGYNLPADSGLSETAGAGYQYTIRLTAQYDCTLLINEEEFEVTGGEEFELYCHQSNYGGAASNVPTLLMYFGSRTNSTMVYPNTITISYLAFDFQ